MRVLLQWRTPVNLILAALVGMLGVRAWPFPSGNVLLSVMEVRTPGLFHGLAYLYAALWFTTPFIALSITTALLYVVVMRVDRGVAYGPLPRYPDPADRTEPFLVLGEQHHSTHPARVAHPTWLTIPRRGLHTGVMVLGAVGTGKTSACLYPYVEQLLAWKPRSPDEKIGGLVLEVKGDFCTQVQAMLTRHGRADDYVEIGLDSPYCYNPLHNDLEPYALAYSIAMLLNNLYGRGKEPFWQQAYTDLVKFLILLRKVVDGYTTLAEVYHYAIDESRIEKDLQRGEAMYGESGPRLRMASVDYHTSLTASAWPDWREAPGDQRVHPYAEDLETFLKDQGIPFTIDRVAPDAAWADRQQQLAAVKRWYFGNWVRLEPRLRSSIVEGIVVFLSLFDDNPAVARAFCPPKSAYTEAPNTVGPRPVTHRTPLPPLEQLLEAGKVLALNFPVGLNPGLARALGVMLKLDFQRAVLARIPKIAASRDRVW